MRHICNKKCEEESVTVNMKCSKCGKEAIVDVPGCQIPDTLRVLTNNDPVKMQEMFMKDPLCPDCLAVTEDYDYTNIGYEQSVN